MPSLPTPATVLITAGPTYEPIDAVRFIGNRSSGRLGVEVARAAHAVGLDVILALGPNTVAPPVLPDRMRIERFHSCADLESLLAELWPAQARVLIMAAAVADYRPRGPAESGKLRRDVEGLTIEMEATPDLVAGCARRRTPGQKVIGFALEPAAALPQAAMEKLERKGLDAIVANPLETMDADEIEGALIRADGRRESPGRLSKPMFAAWLIDRVMRMCVERPSMGRGS